jgi:hypothetical protein
MPILTVADILVILCALAPCVERNGLLQVPVPEVQSQMPEELWPKFNYGTQRVLFVPLPRGA